MNQDSLFVSLNLVECESKVGESMVSLGYKVVCPRKMSVMMLAASGYIMSSQHSVE